MKTIKITLLGAALFFSFLFVADTSANANPSMQIVPETKHYTKKGYHKGKRYTKSGYRHGKRYTKKTWHTGKRVGHKVVNKSHDVVMGKKTHKQ